MTPKRARDISGLDDEALRCTLYRRHGFPLPVFVECTLDGWACLRADLKCDCGTRRVIYLDARTYEEEKSAGYYVWPDSFLVEGGRPSLTEARQEAHRRSTPGAVKAARREQQQTGDRARRNTAPPALRSVS